MRPRQVLDIQLSLIDYLDTGYYRQYLDLFVSDMRAKGQLSGDADGNTIADIEIACLKAAQAYHVQGEMMPVLRAAAMDLEGTDYLVHERLPAEAGLVMFDTPWETYDVWGLQMNFHGFTWRNMTVPDSSGKHQSGIWLAFYTDYTDPVDSEDMRRRLEAQDMDYQELRETVFPRMGRYHVSHLGWMAYGTRLGPQELVTPEEYAQWAMHGEALAEHIPNDMRLVVALFRLLQQVIIEVADADVDRATRRRALRRGIPPRVSTIKLRRKETLRPTEPREFVGALHHRFIVRGHWAWRRCRADHPLAEPYEKGWHARVYIAPFWKGPDDAPIHISQKVWDLSR